MQSPVEGQIGFISMEDGSRTKPNPAGCSAGVAGAARRGAERGVHAVPVQGTHNLLWTINRDSKAAQGK